MSIRDRIMGLLSSNGCGTIPLEELTYNQTMASAGFDSLRFMEFVILFEESFGIEFPDEYLELSMDTTIDDVVQLVMKSLQ